MDLPYNFELPELPRKFSDTLVEINPGDLAEVKANCVTVDAEDSNGRTTLHCGLALNDDYNVLLSVYGRYFGGVWDLTNKKITRIRIGCKHAC